MAWQCDFTVGTSSHGQAMGFHSGLVAEWQWWVRLHFHHWHYVAFSTLHDRKIIFLSVCALPQHGLFAHKQVQGMHACTLSVHGLHEADRTSPAIPKNKQREQVCMFPTRSEKKHQPSTTVLKRETDIQHHVRPRWASATAPDYGTETRNRHTTARQT